MASSNTQIELWRGDEPEWQFVLSKGGAAVDLTGATVEFTCRVGSESGALALNYSKTEGGAGDAEVTFPDASNGKVTVQPDAADTDDLDSDNSYVWDLEVTTAGGEVITYPRDSAGDPVVGTLVVTEDITYT